jgi:hypothetical protein
MLSQVPNVMRVKSDADVEKYAKRLVRWFGERSTFIARISADGFDGETDPDSRETWGRIQRAVEQLQGERGQRV